MICKICGSKKIWTLFTLHFGSHIIKCDECGFVFRQERDFQKREIEYFEKGFHFDLDKKSYDKVHAPLFAEYLNSVPAPYAGKVILDLGCARGTMLRVAEVLGFKKMIGIEPSPEDAGKLSLKHPSWQIHSGQLFESEIDDESVDVVSAIDVFEHLKEPVKDFEKCYSVLKKGGYLLAVTGNADSFCADTRKEDWEYFYTPGHINFFSPDLIRDLFHKIGFRRVYIQCSLDGFTKSFTAPVTKEKFISEQKNCFTINSTVNSAGDYFNEFDLSLAGVNKGKVLLKKIVHKGLRLISRKMYEKGHGMMIIAEK